MCENCGCSLPRETPVGVSAHHHEHEHEHGQDHAHEPGHDHNHGLEHGHDHHHEHGPGEHHDHDHPHPHVHPHTHAHSHTEEDHDHTHEAGGEARRTVEVRQAILGKNDRLAERNRGFFRARGLLVLNFLSSPGSGKTTFIRESVRKLGPDLKTGVIVGDLAPDNDAERL